MKMTAKNLLLLSVAIAMALGSPVDNSDIESRQAPLVNTTYRLGDDVIPSSYELDLTPHFVAELGKQAFTFTGKVTIVLRATRPGVTSIILHQNDLEITTWTLETIQGVSLGSGTYNPLQYEPDTDKWNIPLAAALNDTADSVLKVDYTGHMRDDMKGFYRTYYMETNIQTNQSVQVWMASTQFEQTEARRAFPCFDEPGFKATFKVIIRTPREMSAISNTALVGSPALEADKLRHEFVRTPPMSTYLLAFIVSKYSVNQLGTFGVYARPDAYAQTNLSSTFGSQMLARFDTYLEIPYNSLGITKLDMAAIPDFSAGAMENWGLLTYRETNILHYPDDTPSLSEQRIVAVIAHEQAHQWFGNSLTCKWWSETWLNEGFARYYQFFGTQWLRADWDLEEQFVVENHQQSMQLDATEDTHPMTDPSISTKAQASGIFDNISYNKAASIIRMLSHHIGVDKFKQTQQEYLRTNKDKAVEPTQLFFAIDLVNPVAIGERNVSEIFLPWTTQSGFPLVTVTRDNNVLSLTQKRFMRNGDQTKTERYHIPITFSIDSEDNANTSTKFFLFGDVNTVVNYTLPKTPAKYYLLNNKQTGYYRVNYDVENWRKISEALWMDNHDNIDVLNRAQIVDDLFNLARAGLVKYDTAIDIIRYIKKEKHYAPWLSAITHGLTFLSQRVSGNDNQNTFAWFIRDLMGDIYNHLKFLPATTDRQTDIYNRAQILSWVCKYGHEECVRQSKEIFENFRVDGVKVPKNHRAVVYCNAIRGGSVDHFNFLYNRFSEPAVVDISVEQLNVLSGLACTKEPSLVTRYLELITDTDKIRPQDRTAAINNMLNSNPEGPQWLYDFIVQNHTRWSSKLGNLNTLTTIAGRFTTRAQFDDYAAFLNQKQTELGASFTTLNSALVAARANLEWDDKYMREFVEHLNHLKGSSTTQVISIFASLVSFVVLYIFN